MSMAFFRHLEWVRLRMTMKMFMEWMTSLPTISLWEILRNRGLLKIKAVRLAAYLMFDCSSFNTMDKLFVPVHLLVSCADYNLLFMFSFEEFFVFRFN